MSTYLANAPVLRRSPITTEPPSAHPGHGSCRWGVRGTQRTAYATALVTGTLLACLGCKDEPHTKVPERVSVGTEAQGSDKAAAQNVSRKSGAHQPPAKGQKSMSQSPLELTVRTIDGNEKALADYKGKTLLIVNTASECGFTPQYAGLQALYEKYRSRGLEVLGFPSNDFGSQEPGTCEQIDSFVKDKYKVTFPMFDKVHAKGPDKAPLYKALTEGSGEGISGEVEWNFTKFLVDRQGKVIARFDPSVKPDAPALIQQLEASL